MLIRINLNLRDPPDNFELYTMKDLFCSNGQPNPLPVYFDPANYVVSQNKQNGYLKQRHDLIVSVGSTNSKISDD